jgi:hypothetical protein
MENSNIPNDKLTKSNIYTFTDHLDNAADLKLAQMHGRCQKAYKILTNDLGGKHKLNN